MIDYIYANGDSWTYGNGIDEDPSLINAGYRIPLSKDDRLSFAWPAELGRLIDAKVRNDSLGGGSNARILRTTCNFLQKYPKDAYNNLLVMIGWTTVERDEIYINRPGYNDYYPFNAAQQFPDQFNTDISDDMRRFNSVVEQYRLNYVRYIHNNQMCMTNYFLQIVQMKNLLENLGIKYMFFNAIPWHWLMHDQSLQFEAGLVKNSSDKFLGSLSNETYTGFVEDGKYPMSSCRHPMIEGHRAWAQRIHSELKKVYPNDIT